MMTHLKRSARFQLLLQCTQACLEMQKIGDEKPAWKKQFCAPYQEKLFTGYTVALTRRGLGNLTENIRHQHVLLNSSVLRL